MKRTTIYKSPYLFYHNDHNGYWEIKVMGVCIRRNNTDWFHMDIWINRLRVSINIEEKL